MKLTVMINFISMMRLLRLSPLIQLIARFAFLAARYGKGGDDYLNCPLNEEDNARFHESLSEANSVPLQRFEQTRWFEACLPIEELARRGIDTLRFGPMKPVGLFDPRTGRQPLRRRATSAGESGWADAYSNGRLSNHLRYGEQARVLRMIPGLETQEFPAVRPDTSQYLYQRPRVCRQPCRCGSIQTSSSPVRSPASKAS